MAEVFKLIIEDDEGKTTVYPLDGRVITIGRNEGNVLRLMERNVSRRHARLYRDGDALFIEDIDSYNGVWLNGDRISDRAEVKIGDLVQVGDYHLALRGDEVEAEPAATPAVSPLTPGSARDTLIDEPKPDVASSSERTSEVESPPGRVPPPVPRMSPFPRLICVSGERAGFAFELQAPTIDVGRVEDNDIVIEHPSVSRAHARLTASGGTYVIADRESANGLVVNEEEVASVALANHDLVELGEILFRYVPPYLRFQPTADEALALDRTGTELVELLDESLAATVTDAAPSTAQPRPPAPVPRAMRKPNRRTPLILIGVSAVVVVTALWLIMTQRAGKDVDGALRSLYEAKQYEEAIAYFESNQDRFADPVKAARWRSLAEERRLEGLLVRANRAIEQGAFDEAVELLLACLRASPDSSACHWSLGVAYARSDRAEAAAQHYRRFVELAPADPRVPEVVRVLEAYRSAQAGRTDGR